MVVFFFKQKTAYELRISDWSSDRVLFRSDEAEDDLPGHARQGLLGEVGPRGRWSDAHLVRHELPPLVEQLASSPAGHRHAELGDGCQEIVDALLAPGSRRHPGQPASVVWGRSSSWSRQTSSPSSYSTVHSSTAVRSTLVADIGSAHV